MSTAFLYWLLLASLQSLIILPWVRVLVAFSRRAPAAWLATFFAIGMIAPLLAPVLGSWIPSRTVVMPVLERTGLFDHEHQFETRAVSDELLQPSGLENEQEARKRQWVSWGYRIWLVGFGLFLLSRFWQSLRERLILGRGRLLGGDEPQSLEWQELARKAGLRRVPWLMTHEKVHAVVTVGLLHPVVMIPRDFGALSLAARTMILRHEAEHVRRKDVIMRYFLEILRAVFWFNPLFSWALRSYDVQVEKACDDAVLADGWSVAEYAEVLVHQARRSRSGGKALRLRVRAMLSTERTRRRVGSQRLASGYGVILGLLVLPAFAVKFRPWAENPTFQPLAPREDLAAWWRCRLGHGNALGDWSGHGLHGRIHGARWVRDEIRGACLEFDGINDVIALPAPRTNWTDGPLTIAMWIKPRRGSDGGGLLLRGDPNRAWSAAIVHEVQGDHYHYGERELLLLPGPIGDGSRDQGVYCGFNFFGIQSGYHGVLLPTETWTHIALTVTPLEDGRSQIRYFRNGVARAEFLILRERKANRDWSTSWWWFGCGESPKVQGNYYEGRLSELIIWRRALSAEQLRDVMNGERVGLVLGEEG